MVHFQVAHNPFAKGIRSQNHSGSLFEEHPPPTLTPSTHSLESVHAQKAVPPPPVLNQPSISTPEAPPTLKSRKRARPMNEEEPAQVPPPPPSLSDSYWNGPQNSFPPHSTPYNPYNEASDSQYMPQYYNNQPQYSFPEGFYVSPQQDQTNRMSPVTCGMPAVDTFLTPSPSNSSYVSSSSGYASSMGTPVERWSSFTELPSTNTYMPPGPEFGQQWIAGDNDENRL